MVCISPKRITDEDICKACRESIIAIEGVFLLKANDDCLVIKVYSQYDMEVSIPVGFVFCLLVVFEHFLWKMYITFTDIVGEMRIDLAYSIWNLDLSKMDAVVSMFSDNVLYQIKGSSKVMLIMNEEKQLPEWVFMGRVKRVHRK